MSDVRKFNYNNQVVTFEFVDGQSMVNATQMAKPFPKKAPADFLRLNSTKSFVLALEEDYKRGGSPKEVLRIVKGGNDVELQGTWMDEHLALKFAGWLAPEFEVWVYKKIRELLTSGKTEVRGKNENFGYVLREIAQRFDDQELVNQDFDSRITEVEAKILSKDEDYYSIAGFCSLYKIDCPLPRAKAWGKAAVAKSKEQGADTGKTHDERYGTVRTYRHDILKHVIIDN
ncbi:KilA-N domain-containing protein [Neolewinella agarilytica]|uniref:KilA-N domain-containing protein n=1 Tax=Neolewinella agarilytica TaxID=478744 RepID=A0A1H9HGB2_9BACT|nr:KilA-N domain-containing protein [Neolewinella agarilytica]SEQ61401.1 KilA-N domain-containing protein [Neolewinella agarilytica]